MVRISVIIPVHNQENFIAESIQSVLNQNFEDFELIIIDDASTDNTAKIVQQFLDSRIQCYSISKQACPAQVRNFGLKCVKGDYIAFLDSDDVMLPNTLSALLFGFTQNPDWVIAQGFMLLTDVQLNPLTIGTQLILNSDNTYQIPHYYQHDAMQMVKKRTLHGLPSMMFRRSVLGDVGLLNDSIRYSEDYEYYLRILAYYGVERMGILPIYTCMYRRHASSHSQSVDTASAWLDSNLQILDWASNQTRFQTFFKNSKSHIVLARYSDYLSSLLNQGRRQESMCIIFRGLLENRIKMAHKLWLIIPFIRALFPVTLQRAIVTLRWRLRA